MTVLAQLGKLELSVMECVWRLGAGSVNDVVGELKLARAYTTIMTTLDRLHRKGLLARTLSGRAYIYEPRIGRGELQEARSREFFATALSDTVARRPILSCLVDTIGAQDREALDLLEELIQQKRKELRRRG